MSRGTSRRRPFALTGRRGRRSIRSLSATSLRAARRYRLDAPPGDLLETPDRPLAGARLPADSSLPPDAAAALPRRVAPPLLDPPAAGGGPDPEADGRREAPPDPGGDAHRALGAGPGPRRKGHLVRRGGPGAAGGLAPGSATLRGAGGAGGGRARARLALHVLLRPSRAGRPVPLGLRGARAPRERGLCRSALVPTLPRAGAGAGRRDAFEGAGPHHLRLSAGRGGAGRAAVPPRLARRGRGLGGGAPAGGLPRALLLLPRGADRDEGLARPRRHAARGDRPQRRLGGRLAPGLLDLAARDRRRDRAGGGRPGAATGASADAGGGRPRGRVRGGGPRLVPPLHPVRHPALPAARGAGPRPRGGRARAPRAGGGGRRRPSDAAAGARARRRAAIGPLQPPAGARSVPGAAARGGALHVRERLALGLPLEAGGVAPARRARAPSGGRHGAGRRDRPPDGLRHPQDLLHERASRRSPGRGAPEGERAAGDRRLGRPLARLPGAGGVAEPAARSASRGLGLPATAPRAARQARRGSGGGDLPDPGAPLRERSAAR